MSVFVAEPTSIAELIRRERERERKHKHKHKHEHKHKHKHERRGSRARPPNRDAAQAATSCVAPASNSSRSPVAPARAARPPITIM